VDFRNTLIVMTSNMGSEYLANLADGDDVEKARPAVMDVVRKHFRPEFMNRIDEIILFKRLGRAEMDGIVRIQMQRVEKLLADRRMSIALDGGALHWLADRGYDPVYGARPLKTGHPEGTGRSDRPETPGRRPGRRRCHRRPRGRGRPRDRPGEGALKAKGPPPRAGEAPVASRRPCASRSGRCGRRRRRSACI